VAGGLCKVYGANMFVGRDLVNCEMIVHVGIESRLCTEGANQKDCDSIPS